MSSPLLCAIILLACAFTFSAAQTSCKGRCGAEYYRGYMCQCDYDCLVHDECCRDYEAQCTTKNSCKGRCGETFKRGRRCSCDSGCMKYNQCCSDYKDHCDTEEPPLNEPAEQPDLDDHLVPLVTPASDLQDNLSNDVNDPIYPSLPDDPYFESGLEYTQATSIPESHSGYEPSPTDLLELVSTDPTVPDIQDKPESEFKPEETFTLFPQTPEVPSDSTPTQAIASPAPSDSTNGEVPIESADASDPKKQSDPTNPSDSGTSPPQPFPTSTVVPHYSSQPTPTSEPQAGPTATASTPKIQPEGSVAAPEEVFPDVQKLDPAEEPSGQPEVLPLDPEKADRPESDQATTTPGTDQTTIPESTVPTQDSSSAPELSETTPASPVTTTAAPSKPDQTPMPEATTPKSDSLDVQATTFSYPSAPSITDSQAPGPEPGPDSVARGDTPDSWNGPGPQDDALTTRAPSVTDPAQTEKVDGVTPGETTTDLVKVTPAPAKPKPSKPTSKPQVKPKPSPTKPSLAKPTSKPVPKPLDPTQTVIIDRPGDYQADDSNDTNLCSGRPTSGVTTLRNGTMVIFRGHYFWVLGSDRVPGPARGITEVWGVPSPIDTVFTRCNCQGKTYIFKGTQYWRFDNDVLDSGYPKPLQTGFDGLRGHITAALSVPQYQRRREAVYFFKRGGLVQKYSYQFGTTPTCGRNAQYAIYTTRNRVTRQAVSVLEPAINIRTSWRGFPTSITSAVSIPTRRVAEGYKYYVFSRSKYYNVQMNGNRPVIAAPPANAPPQRNSANDFFKCPNKV